MFKNEITLLKFFFLKIFDFFLKNIFRKMVITFFSNRFFSWIFFFNDVVFSSAFETIFWNDSFSARIGHKIDLKITFPTFWPPKKCHILLAARILRKIFPKFFFIHIILTYEQLAKGASVFRRHFDIVREPTQHPWQSRHDSQVYRNRLYGACPPEWNLVPHSTATAQPQQLTF